MENTNLPRFHLERSHLLLQGFYGDFLCHNNGSHLDGWVLDDALWQRRWRQLAAQLESHGTPRYPSSLPTSFLKRHWASAGP